jgi:dipeptidyl aminopeptidase/acylaminoacyl peptidase
LIVFRGLRLLGVLALIFLTSGGCAPGQIVAPSERPSPTSTLASASPTPALSPAKSGPPPAVQTKALGTLRGQWVFVGREIVQLPSQMQREVQIWAVPVDGGSPVQAVSYPAAVPLIESLSDLTPYLRRQFSPDGMRLVLSVQGDLVIVDLATGAARPLGAPGVGPLWSKDGLQIAYVNAASQSSVSGDSRIWIVPVGGGPSREIPARAGSRPTPIEWSPDSSQLLVSSLDGIDVVDVRSGGSVRHIDGQAWVFGHWRSATPQIALPTVTSHGATVVSRLVTLDNSSAPERVLLESKETFDAGGVASPSISFSDPRWDPASNEILYVETRQTSTGASAFKAHVYDVASGRDSVVALDAYQATWTWDGKQIVYLTPSVAFRGYGGALRIATRDASGSRELMGGGNDVFFFNVASLNY